MKRLFLVAAAAVALGACSDMFSPPELPDLFKDPYDFAVDHNGNIFVAEWVEIGRVTKLRKVA